MVTQKEIEKKRNSFNLKLSFLTNEIHIECIKNEYPLIFPIYTKNLFAKIFLKNPYEVATVYTSITEEGAKIVV